MIPTLFQSFVMPKARRSADMVFPEPLAPMRASLSFTVDFDASVNLNMVVLFRLDVKIITCYINFFRQ